jgi:hypothetical protein
MQNKNVGGTRAIRYKLPRLANAQSPSRAQPREAFHFYPCRGFVPLNLGSAFIVDENTVLDAIPKTCSRFPLLSLRPFYQQINDRGNKQPQHCN